MIVLKASGTDDNPTTSASTFASIPQPIGVSDGDLVLVGIALPVGTVTITPPDDSWTKVTQSNIGADLNVSVYWKFALNEPSRWVFTLSASTRSASGVLVYAGVDGYEPVQSSRAFSTPSGTSHAIGPIASADNNQELAIFASTLSPEIVSALSWDFVNMTGGPYSTNQVPVPGLPDWVCGFTGTGTLSTTILGSTDCLDLKVTSGGGSSSEVGLTHGSSIGTFPSTGSLYYAFTGKLVSVANAVNNVGVLYGSLGFHVVGPTYAAFRVTGTGHIFAVNSVLGGETTTDLGAGISPSVAHDFEIESFASGNTEFRIDNVLVATHSTNQPTAGAAVRGSADVFLTGTIGADAHVIASGPTVEFRSTASVTFTFPSPLEKVFTKTAQNYAPTSAISAARTTLQNAGDSPIYSVTTNVTAIGAFAMVVLARSVGALTLDEVQDRIIASLPRDVDKVYDLTPTGDYYKYFRAMAMLLKVYGFDLIDTVRLEIVPYLSRYKLPDWERIFGLATSFVAKRGTIPQRQAQVLGSWRGAAGQGSTFEIVRATLAPLLGYENAADLQVIETSQSLLRTQHSLNGIEVTAPTGGTTSGTILVTNDGGIVSQAGIRLMPDQTVGTYPVTYTLTAPDGVTTKSWTLAERNEYLYGKEFAGADVYGAWTFSVTNNTGGTVIVDGQLFVEGIGVGQETGGAIFHWGIYADPALMGVVTPANLTATRNAISKLTFDHCFSDGSLIQSTAPYPDTDSGAHASIPDECIPT